MSFSKITFRLLFIPLLLLAASAQAAEYNDANALLQAGSPGVNDLDKDPLIISGVDIPADATKITTTYGGASLTVSKSYLTINAGENDAYSAGLAGYNAPVPGGAPTTFENAAFDIIKGNLTSGMDTDAKAPGVMNFNDVIVHLNGASAQDAVIYGYGLSPELGQEINFDLTSNKFVSVPYGKNGAILTHYGTVNLISGSLEAGSATTSSPGATLELNTGVWKPSGIKFADPGSTDTATYNIKKNASLQTYGGLITSKTPTQLTINLEEGANLNAVNGKVNLQSNWEDGATLNANGNIAISGANSAVWAGQLNIGNGANITLGSADDTASANWATLSGYKGVEISGGDITLNPGSEIQAGSANGMQIKGGTINLAGSGPQGQAGSAQLRFSGIGKNSMEGGAINVAADKQGSIAAGQKLDMSGGEIKVDGTLNLAGSNIGSGGTQEVNAYAMDMTGGSIAVGENGALNITGDLDMTVNGGALTNAGTVAVGGAQAASLKLASPSAQSALDDLTKNGKVSLGATGEGEAILSFNGDLSLAAANLTQTAEEKGQIGMGEKARLETSGTLTLTETGEYDLNLPNSVIAAGGLDLQGGPVTFSGGAIQLNGVSSGAALAGDGLTVNSGATLVLGDAAGNGSGSIESDLTNSGGDIAINSGEWTLGSGKTLAVNDGALRIGGQKTDAATVSATLDVSKGALQIGKDAAYADETLSTGVGVLDGGTLITSFDQLFDAENSDATLLESARKIYLAENGAITIAKATVENLSDLTAYREALLIDDPGRGTVNWQDITVKGNPVDGELAESIVGDNVFASNDLAYGEEGRYDPDTKTVAVASESSIGGKTIVLTGEAATAAETVTVGDPSGKIPNNTLTLLGETSDTDLITRDEPNGAAASNIKKVAIAPNSTLKLGSDSITGQTQGGRLGGDVTLADGARLETAAGQFSTGAITALDDAATQVIVKAGSSLAAPVAGSSNAPITSVDNSGDLNVTGNLVATSVTNAGNIVAKSMTAGNLTSSGGKLDLGSLALGSADASTRSVIASGTANISDLDVKGLLTAGGTEAAPNINVKTANLASGRLVFDHPGVGMARGGIESFGPTGADMDVLRNAIVTVGSGAPSGWAETALPKTGLTAANNGAYNSVLAIYTPLTVKNGGSISVGAGGAPVAALTRALARETMPTGRAASASTFALGEKAILLINGPTAGDGAIVAGGPAPGKTTAVAQINPRAKVAIAGARPDTNYTIFAVNPDNNTGWQVVNSEDETQPGLTADQIATDNPLMRDFTVAMTPEGALLIHSNAPTPAAQVFPSVGNELASVLDTAFANNQIGVGPEFTHAGPRGTQFLSRALVMANNGLADKAGRTLESAGRILSLGAAPQMTLTANRAAGSAITQRTTLAEPPGNLYAMNARGETGARAPRDYAGALWIMPLFQSANGFSMKAGPHDYDFSGTLGGVALGADYTVNDMGRFGVAFNIGGGYAEGSGTLNKTTNNMNFWGVGAYAGANQDNIGLMADIFYTSTYNKLRQDTPAEMAFGTLKADVRGQAISTGLRAEYKIPTEAMDIIPHAGFRYTNLKMDSYKVKSVGTVMKGNATEQNIWEFPVGVTMTKVVELDQGWRFKPLLDLNVIPAAGDFDTKNKIRFTGTGTKAELETKSMDYITYGGAVGLEFSNDSLSLAINYSGEFGEESSAHGVFGTLRYEF